MKRILLLLALSIAVASPVRSGESLSAEEVAFHLGVRSWVSQIQLEGADHTVEVLHVVNGEVVKSLMDADAYPTDRELTRIAILANSSENRTLMSIRIASAPAPRGLVDAVPLDVTIPLPSKLSAGEYVLGGSVILDGKPRPTIKDVKNGLILRISKRPKNAADGLRGAEEVSRKGTP